MNQKNILSFEENKDPEVKEDVVVEEEEDPAKELEDKMMVFKKDIMAENLEDFEEQMLGKRMANLPDAKKQKL